MPGKINPDLRKLTDEELIARFQKDDIDAFNEIVNRYKDKIVNFLYRYTGSREDCEDIAQEAFLNLYRFKHKYVEVGKFSAWFYRIAINIAKSNLAKRKKNVFSINNAFDDDEKDYELPSKDVLPDEELNSSNESQYIQKAIDSLKESYRQVIVLRDIQDLDYEEIARVLEIPIGTVKSRINRARECLKEILEHFYKSRNK